MAQNSGFGFLILSSFRLKLQVSIRSQRENNREIDAHSSPGVAAANHLLSYERLDFLFFHMHEFRLPQISSPLVGLGSFWMSFKLRIVLGQSPVERT